MTRSSSPGFRPMLNRPAEHGWTEVGLREDETMPIDRDVLTTGEVAKLCNVAPRTVSKWFDSGALKGYRIPGSKDRRIPLGELLKFMKAHGIPTDSVDSGRTRVLIADGDADVVRTLQQVLADQTSYDVRTATSGFRAGLECHRFRPHVLITDLHLADADCRAIAEDVRACDQLQMTRVIAMSSKLTEAQAQALRADGFDGFLRKPFQLRQIVQAIEHATNLAA